MNGILGMVRLLQHTELTARQQDYTNKTQVAAQSLLGILNDILDFSKVEAGKMTLEHHSFSLDRVMRDLSQILSANLGSKPIEVLYSMDAGLASEFQGDALRLQQILLNLAGNAIKFTEQGEVVVSVRLIEQGVTESEIEFSVKDSGIGIAEDKLHYIFEGFSQAEASTTRRFGGTGLGLAISQRLVDLMGGTLSLESQLGVGSRFYFTLKLTHAAPAATPKRPEDSAAATYRPPQNALVVDDHGLAAEAMRKVLESLGWQAQVVTSSDAALASVRSHQAGPGEQFPYSVIFVDWEMPGCDGWETAQRIRELPNGKQPAIVLMAVAHGREVLAERLRADPVLLDAFLTKPATKSMVAEAILESAAARSGIPGRTRSRQLSTRLTGLRLLVVDDNPMNQQVALELLKGEGASVDVASGGRESVALTLAAEPPYDAVLMDIQMPDMDGYDATREIRQSSRMQSQIIIAMTANALAADKEACLAVGMNDHIGKPIDLDLLVGTLLRRCRRDAPPGVVAPVLVKAAASVPVVDSTDQTDAIDAIDVDAALARLGGMRSLYGDILRAFIDEAAGLPTQLRVVLQGEAKTDAVRLMHTLKGTAGTIGATALQRYAAAQEALLKQDIRPEKIDAMTDELSARLRQTLQLLSAVEKDFLPDEPVTSASGVLDSPAFTAALKGLMAQLDVGNMRATSLFDEIQREFGSLLGAKLKPLEKALDRLDFRQALHECQVLLKDYP